MRSSLHIQYVSFGEFDGKKYGKAFVPTPCTTRDQDGHFKMGLEPIKANFDISKLEPSSIEQIKKHGVPNDFDCEFDMVSDKGSMIYDIKKIIGLAK